MGNAEEEMEQLNGSQSGEEWCGIKSADPESFQSHPTDEDMAISKGDTRALDSDSIMEGDSSRDDPSALQSAAGKYIPDHLFSVALANSRPRNGVRPSQTTPKARSTTKKRRHPHARVKDVVVGWVPVSHLDTFL